jgi:ATP-dependent RNA helicase RhlE
MVEVTPQSSAAETVDHYYYKTPNLKAKINMLSFLLKDPSFNKVMVFTRTKETANNVFKFIQRKLDDQVRVIHANKSQNSRINAFNDFREGRIRVLVSTDVSARGLDIYMVSHVINFDVPRMYEEYVHRIGRTGRAQRSGVAISFANEAEEIHMREIEKVISEEIDERLIPEEIEIPETGREEAQQIAIEIDRIKRAKDPDFKGAFHEKKERHRPKPLGKQKNKKRKR